ncbi:hypothetical protein [Streptomyces syringium]|uniref:hypothetical protein n=1 Tax=Streptomyces syringium TaxID=76729 RepID=UPI0037CF7268
MNLLLSLRRLIARMRPGGKPWRAVRSRGVWSVRNDLTTVTVSCQGGREDAEALVRRYNAAEAAAGPYDLLPPTN